MKTRILPIILLAVLTFTSCSVEKKHYMKGYHVEWNNSSLSAKPKASKPPVISEIVETAAPEKMQSREAEEIITPGDTCDLIRMKDGTSVHAKISLVEPNSITYTTCQHPGGPKRVVNKSEVDEIQFSNGLREKIVAAEKKPDPVVQNPEAPAEQIVGFSAPSPSRKLATHSFIFGLCSFIPMVGWAFALVSMGFGIGALCKNRKEKNTSARVFAMIGITAAAIGLAAGITIVAVYFPELFLAFLSGLFA